MIPDGLTTTPRTWQEGEFTYSESLGAREGDEELRYWLESKAGNARAAVAAPISPGCTLEGLREDAKLMLGAWWDSREERASA